MISYIKKIKIKMIGIKAMKPDTLGTNVEPINNPYHNILPLNLINIRLLEFFNIWPIEQWISSLFGLVLMYWVATGFYNKRLKNYKLEMSFKFRFWMILSDLLINLGLGLYYLGYRETIMGQLMLKCPIAVSPVIFVVELLVVILIKEYEIYESKKKKKTW